MEPTLVATYVVGVVIAALIAGRFIDTQDDDADLAPFSVGMIALLWPMIVVFGVPLLLVGGIGTGALAVWGRRREKPGKDRGYFLATTDEPSGVTLDAKQDAPPPPPPREKS